MSFRALVLNEAEGKVSAAVEDVDEAALPEGEVTVAVSHSTLNYKDAMILAGIGRLVRTYPHVPGIDFVGTVESSESPAFRPGDAVILTGWRVGETRWGGYAEKARVKAEWLVRLPERMTPARAMAIGTAGLTAMLAVIALEEAGVRPDSGDVLVTGANGGLGGVAIALLARAGYRVVASTGRTEAADHLKALGAAEVIDRAETASPPERPLVTERWAGAIDAVGGDTLAAILPALRYRGAVASCGNAGGNAFKTTVIPFLLRGVRVIGIDSAMCPMPERERAWARLARDLPAETIDRLSRVAGLADLPALARDILAGKVQGRVVVDVHARTAAR